MEDTGSWETLGRYRLLRQIGHGGMGEVWLAEDPHLQRQVALKVLPSRKRDDEEFLRRFEREARAAAALHHPHILPVHDYGQQQMPNNQTVTYLVMSYVSGGSVEDRLKALASGQGMLTQDEALTYLFQVAEAIDFAHAHNIIHRDIKPANMLLRDDNWLLLTDFGIARILTDMDSSATGAYLGTPTYMAPEQAQGNAVAASDIYSLAVVAYQLFTGRVPFQADNPFALSFQHAFTPPTSPRVYNPTLSLELEKALLRGLQKDPAQRPPSATAYITSLDRALKSFPSHLPTPVQAPASSVTPRPTTSVTRRRVLAGVGIGVGVVLVGGGAAAYAATSLARHAPPVVKATPAVHATPTTAANEPLAISAAFTKPVMAMAWAPEKNILATCSREGRLVLWDLTAAQPSASLSPLAQVNSGMDDGILLSWSPDGTMLAVGNWGFDGDATAYETLIYTADLSGPAHGFTDQTLLENASSVRGLGWTASNYLATVASARGDTSITRLSLWNMRQPGQKALTTDIKAGLPFVLDKGNCLAASPDGSLLTICLGGGLQPGRLNTGGKGKLWQPIGSVLLFNGIRLSSVAWSADGRYVAGISVLPTDNGVVGVWDATQHYQLALPRLAASSVPASVLTMAWSPASSGTWLALGGDDGNVYLWNVGKSPEPARILSHNIQGSVTSLAWSADGRWLAASYDDNLTTILLWRM
ncbi:MAG TPA: serine/threonine-protein kinase [Ktedonobacteraceae bacterium]|nr:serine/threonine-protein kinase [Ktedonobacteraceae bacterium]